MEELACVRNDRMGEKTKGLGMGMKRHLGRRIGLMLLAASGAFGCASPMERHLGTTPAYHALLAQPFIAAPQTDATLLDFPHYLVGVESGNPDSVERIPPCPSGFHQEGPPYCVSLEVLPAGSPWRKKIATQIEHRKPLFVSHIMRIAPLTSPNGAHQACVLYSAYPPAEFPNAAACAPPVAAMHAIARPLSVEGGLEALSAFGRELEERLSQAATTDRPTHLIVMSTGWNTLQSESIDNYRHWLSHLMLAAKEDPGRSFRPLVIGLSWPSEWPLVSTWLGPVISVFNKENDADELGYVTINLLLHSVLDRLKKKYGTPVVVIGHSFGGRATVTGTTSRSLLFGSEPTSASVDLLLGLQPAFSIERFGGGIQGDPYADFPLGARKYVLSTSTNDWILKSVGLTNPVGGDRGLSKARAMPERFEIITLMADGQWATAPSPSPCRIAMLEASAVIDGHHDVYSAQIGRLMWQAIQTFAPADFWPSAAPSTSVSPCRSAGP